VDVWVEGQVYLLDATADQFGEQYPSITFGRMGDFSEYGWDPDLG
jgi:hypothetical protein